MDPKLFIVCLALLTGLSPIITLFVVGICRKPRYYIERTSPGQWTSAEVDFSDNIPKARVIQ